MFNSFLCLTRFTRYKTKNPKKQFGISFAMFEFQQTEKFKNKLNLKNSRFLLKEINY